MLNKDLKKNEMYKSSIEKLLPEPQPNSKQLLIGLPSATLAQNALLCAVHLAVNLRFNHFQGTKSFLFCKSQGEMNFINCQAVK